MWVTPVRARGRSIPVSRLISRNEALSESNRRSTPSSGKNSRSPQMRSLNKWASIGPVVQGEARKTSDSTREDQVGRP